MTATVRLRICAAILALSAIYAVLVARDPEFAGVVAAGYIAILLTVLLLLNIWKRPDNER